MGTRRFPRRERWIAAAPGNSEAGRERSSSLDAEAHKKMRLKIPLKNQEAGFFGGAIVGICATARILVIIINVS